MKVVFREPDARGSGEDPLVATVTVETAPELQARIAVALGALTMPTAPHYPTVVVRRSAPTGDLTGSIALLPVDRARSLAARVAAAREAGAIGIQLVFDDRCVEDAARVARLRAAIFAILEAERAGRSRCPLRLARTRRPCLALRLAIAQKGTLR